MGNPAGVRRDFSALEKRRFEAIRLLDEGLNQADIAQRLKVSRSTVVRWVSQYRRQGREALRKAGRRPRLSPQDRQRLKGLLVRGPEAVGYETPLWTCPRVAHLIEKEFDIIYHAGHVWKVLVGLGWSPQRPTGKAREGDEQQIRMWKRRTWPDIKKKPTGKGVRSSSLTKAD